MKKEDIKTVDKVWGEEIILVNSHLYCGKLLIGDRGAESSYHYHKKKQETFYAIEGYAVLTIEGKEYLLSPVTRPKTIEPEERHSFRAITEVVILEISSHHDDEDVVRLTESKEGNANEYGMVGSQ